MVHIGFWDFIDNRCFFIPRVTREKTEYLTRESSKGTYYWGEKEHWKCYETELDNILIKEKGLKVIDVDEEFFIYQRARRMKEKLAILKTEISQKESNKSTKHTISIINKRIAYK